jgi:hypothetical protein
MVSYNIISTKLAEDTYLQNIEYLENIWSEKEIIKFIKKVDEVVSILKISPQTFKKYRVNQNIHQIEIMKQITLFYQINDNNVELLLFFNNYQDPNQLKKLL